MAYMIEFRADGESDSHIVCFFITLKYRLADDSTLCIDQEAAWCKHCQRFVTAERVPSLEELEQFIHELEAPTQKHYFIFGSKEGIRAGIVQLETQLRWRRNRESAARCLSCGSTDVMPVRFDENRSFFLHGKRFVEVDQGFADTRDWIAEYTPEGLAIPANE